VQDVKYKPGDWLLFGSEVDGLPPAALEECHYGPYARGIVQLPMNDTFVCSLNLSMSVGVGVYEACTQNRH
jgi:tRNA (cytidine/uridine-2'-O-)-methyltransferase